VLSAYPIQVNHPLSLGFLNVYQSTYGTEALVQLQGAGKLTSAAVGQSLTVGESELLLAGTQKTEEGLAVRVEEWKNQQKVGSRLEKAGDKLGPFNLVSVSEREVTGLNAVNDPGSLPVLLALLIGLSGFVLTAVQKKKGDSI
jgi:cytochrome c biogenesis protein ResB